MDGSGDGPEDYHGYSVDDEDQPQSFGDSLADAHGLREPLDEGVAPPDRWSAGMRFGNTPWEEAHGETLRDRLAQEEAEPDPYAEVVVPEEPSPYRWPRQVGRARAGRLLADGPWFEDHRSDDLNASDVGIDGAGASAEEAAMHVIEDESWS